MNRLPLHDELIEMAALYALGILDKDEADIFDSHLAEGCEACRSELVSFESVVSDLGFGTDEVAPSPGLREALISCLADSGDKDGDEQSNRGQFLSIYSVEGEWNPVLDGVLVKLLSIDEETGYFTSLVRMKPGTHLPRHMHRGVEQFFILEGDCHVHGDVLGPGDYHRAEAGSIHETTYTEGGTLFLLIAPESFQVMDDR